MKKLLCVIIFSAMIFSGAHAQINYEASLYPTLPVRPVLLTFNHMSPKWMIMDYSNIKLYYQDHSLYQLIPIPSQSASSFGVYNLTDDLFDNDSTNLEFIVASAIAPINFVKIYRENGTLLFVRDSANANALNIVPSDSGTKMVLGIYTPSFDHF